MMQSPLCYVHGSLFSGMVEEIKAITPEQVAPSLELVQKRVAQGLHAAGFVSYEAAPGVNPDLSTHRLERFPLLWFGLFRDRSQAPFPEQQGSYRCSAWTPSLSATEYGSGIDSIRDLIAAGDCYQINFTMQQRFAFSGCPRAYFSDISRSQTTAYASYIECGEHRILSASPELFFSLDHGKLTTRPMKGTAPRGRWWQEDEAAKQEVRRSAKERAENLMIVDLLRNDMGMVSETGSVRVSSLFDVETLFTVHQMTSTVESQLRQEVSLAQLFAALFPCGSITGAPKRRSMEIIRDLEQGPRGIYTGCIGFVTPQGEAQFSVAIRTAVIDTATGCGELGIGSGVTYDSKATAEYAECLAKGRFARQRMPEFHLIESLLHDGEYFLAERHLQRLSRSAEYFSFPFHRHQAWAALEEEARRLPPGKHKVRLLLYNDGGLHCESSPLPDPAQEARAAFAQTGVDSNDRLLYHKTSLRDLFTAELAKRPECAEVIFANERGEITEGSYSNIVVSVAGELLTPPLESGLLPGVFREELLESGKIREKVLTREDLVAAQDIYLINSVRKWRRVTLVH